MSKRGEMSRRNFLKAIGAATVAGVGIATGGCASEPAGGKGWLPKQYDVPANWSVQVKGRVPLAADNPALVRDDRKCVLCGQCLEVCRNSMSVYGYYGLPLKQELVCVHCGQCSMACPTGAIAERRETDAVRAALDDPLRRTVIQIAPALNVSLGEEFGLPPGRPVAGKIVAALKRMGFAAVFDTAFAADLTVMEEATEWLQRLNEGAEPLPQLTSCCPGWVKFCEYYYPELLERLSSCKSPQQMLGRIIKTHYAKRQNVRPEQLMSVAAMPCTAKKFECRRADAHTAVQEVDAVLTARELAEMIKRSGLDLNALPEEAYDLPFGESSGAGMLFAASGGVTEAAVRTAVHLSGARQIPAELLSWTAVRNLAGVKEAEVRLADGRAVRVAVCQGLKNARTVLEEVRNGSDRWQFVEVMACPGGCIGGGGQPRTSLPPNAAVCQARSRGLYQLDEAAANKRCSFENQAVQALYDEWMNAPRSEIAQRELHTKYVDRSSSVNALPR